VEIEKLKADVKTLESSKIMVEMVETSYQKVRTEYFLDKLKLLEEYIEGLSERLTKETNSFRRFLKQELFEYVDDEHSIDVRGFTGICWIFGLLRF
jgi:DNA repair exonuclease SbcCD ATPase subunit